MADSGARANVGTSKVRGRIPRLGLSRGSRTNALAARIEKMQAEMQFCDMGEPTHHSNEDIMAPSDQREKYDVREMTGMIGSFPPPPRSNTKIDVMYKMMDALDEKMEALSKEQAVQAEKRAAMDEKMKTLSKEEIIQAEKRVVLDEKMDLLSKLLDAMS